MKRKKLAVMSVGILLEIIAIVVITASESPAIGSGLLVIGLLLVIIGFVLGKSEKTT